MFLGIDLGTSGVKALLVDGEQRVVATTTIPLTVQRPAPGWSEQDPEAWWQACLAAIDTIARDNPAAVSAIQAIGLGGQMHGAVILDEAATPLRPAILWNDTRAEAECAALEAAFPALRQVAGNIAMPGFTAPKLLWVRTHEPDIFARTRTVLLPKAYLRYRLTGEMIEDMSDASGTLWLDVATRDWSDAALAATSLDRTHMPRLVEGNAPAGRLRPDLAARWHMPTPPILAGGAGDNAAGAIGIGAIQPGDAFISLGTSGVVFATTDGFRPWPQAAVHAFCHALPHTWHQMGVTLSAASSLSWWSTITNLSEAQLLAELPDITEPGAPLFLPYLGGERTPHNDGQRRAHFANLSHTTDRPALTQAVLEGVAYSLRDCLDALSASGTIIREASVIGGGARSPTWLHLLANILAIPLHRLSDADHGVSYGATRLARLALTNEPPTAICTKPHPIATITPNPALSAAYADRLSRYRALATATA